ncbi:MAG TPA: chaperone modulator CbpM [Lautropia sp.]|nr:chaperone modulator CbpM [Lautropia sp.]
MNTERIEAVWVEEQHLLSVDDLGGRWGLSASQVRDFIAQGVLEPISVGSGTGSFRIEQVPVVRTACRLQQELELDTHAVGVVLELVQRVRALEDELKALRARLPGEPAAPTDDEAVRVTVISPRRS